VYSKALDGTRRAEMDCMTPVERRIALIRLIAEIDQQIGKAEDFAYRPDLTVEERSGAVAQLALRRNAVIRVEGLLAEIDNAK
jgi:hypothetical protein